MPDGSEKPIGYALRTLNKARRIILNLKEGILELNVSTHIYLDTHLNELQS